jgi:hypothetical protein
MIVGVSQPLSRLNDKNCNLRISAILAKKHDSSTQGKATFYFILDTAKRIFYVETDIILKIEIKS